MQSMKSTTPTAPAGSLLHFEQASYLARIREQGIALQAAGTPQANPSQERFASKPKTATKPMSDAQRNFMVSLIEQKFAPETATIMIDAIDGCEYTTRTASQMIDKLKGMARYVAPAPLAPAAPPATESTLTSGHYAIEGADGEMDFYKVDVITEGKWAGYTFVKHQASDDYYPVRNRTQRQNILDQIALDPKAASIAYGHAIGKCGVCNRTLTDASSIANGIGPVCAEKTGW